MIPIGLGGVITHVGGNPLWCCCDKPKEDESTGGAIPGEKPLARTPLPARLRGLEQVRRSRRKLSTQLPVVEIDSSDTLPVVNEIFEKPSEAAPVLQRSVRRGDTHTIRRRMQGAGNLEALLDVQLRMAFQKFLQQEELSFFFLLAVVATEDEDDPF